MPLPLPKNWLTIDLPTPLRVTFLNAKGEMRPSGVHECFQSLAEDHTRCGGKRNSHKVRSQNENGSPRHSKESFTQLL